MSWAAHQFETYAIQAHLPERWRPKISYLAIVAGDQFPDFVAKFWVYGVTIGDTHYGAKIPHEFHRGWPGAGFSHSIFFGLLVVALVWRFTRSKAWALGLLLGFTAHCVTDVNDSVGTMLLWPFSTLNFSIGTWAYAATVEGGKYLDAAAYYSSFGLVMDLFWLVVLLLSWRVLTADYWRTYIVTADPKVWAWLGRRFREPVLLAIYRATFFYGVCRVVAWTTWAHVIEDFPMDLHWNGPYWIESVYLDQLPVVVVVAVSAVIVAGVCFTVDRVIRRDERRQVTAA
jgi:hypothetical protein